MTTLHTAYSFGDEDWSEPLRLSSPFEFAWFPDIEADDSGAVHVVWSSGSLGFDTVVYTTNWNDFGWLPPNDIVAIEQFAGSAATRPSLLYDDSHFLHLSYAANNVYYTNSDVGSAYSSQSWSKPISLNSDQIGYFTRMVKDSKGTLHYIFTENSPDGLCLICYHVFHRSSIDNGINWSEAIDVSVMPMGAAKPSVIVDSRDGIHIVWEAGYGGGLGQLSDPTSVYHAFSQDGGKSWSKPFRLDSLTDPQVVSMARNVVVGLGDKDTLLAVWLSIPEDRLYFRISHDFGVTWEQAQQIQNVWGGWSVYQARLDAYTLVADSDNHLHLIFVGRRIEDSIDIELLHTVWDGQTWHSVQLIHVFRGDVPEWPRATVGLGNQLHVVWFVRNKEDIFNSDSGRYSVWYSTKRLRSTAIAPIDIPRISPSSLSLVPEYEPKIEPSLAVPTRQIRSVVVENISRSSHKMLMPDLRSENDEVLLLFLSAVPVLGVVLLTTGIILLQRRRAP